MGTAPDSAGPIYVGWMKLRSTGLVAMTRGTALVCGVGAIAAVTTAMAAGPRAGVVVVVVSVLVAAPSMVSREGGSGYDAVAARWRWRRGRRAGRAICRLGMPR